MYAAVRRSGGEWVWCVSRQVQLRYIHTSKGVHDSQTGTGKADGVSGCTKDWQIISFWVLIIVAFAANVVCRQHYTGCVDSGVTS